MKLGFLWGAAGKPLAAVEDESPLRPRWLFFSCPIVSPFALPSSIARRDSSSASKDFGRYLSNGSRAELSDKWNNMQKIRKTIIRISGPMAVLIPNRPIRQTMAR